MNLFTCYHQVELNSKVLIKYIIIFKFVVVIWGVDFISCCDLPNPFLIVVFLQLCCVQYTTDYRRYHYSCSLPNDSFGCLLWSDCSGNDDRLSK